VTEKYGATFDYVCHPILCPRCETVAANPCEIDMQIKLGSRKELRSLRVGDSFEPSSQPERDGGYLRLRDHIDPGRLVALETWTCPNCGSSFLWARLVVENNRLTVVEPVALTEDVLAGADYVTAEALMLFPMDRTLEIKALAPSALRHALVETVSRSSDT